MKFYDYSEQNKKSWTKFTMSKSKLINFENKFERCQKINKQFSRADSRIGLQYDETSVKDDTTELCNQIEENNANQRVLSSKSIVGKIQQGIINTVEKSKSNNIFKEKAEYSKIVLSPKDQNEPSCYDSKSISKFSKKTFFQPRNKNIQKQRLKDMQCESYTNHHLINFEKLYAIYGTHPDEGLGDHEVMKRMNQDGPNALSRHIEESNLFLLVGYIFKGFSAMLWFGAILSFIAYFLEAQTNVEKPGDNLWLGFILVATCVITGVFSYYQEKKGTEIIDTFMQMVPSKATVIRNGNTKEVNAVELVKGDIVLLKSGDRVPADIRLIQNQDLKVENSSLTGEIEPVSCTIEPTNGFAVESRNIVFFSTNVVSGYGKGVVLLTGSQTAMGKIAGLTNNLEKKRTPIELEIQHFMHIISAWALFLGMICFILAKYIGYTWLSACIYVIGIIVANVPEGLLATLTVSLTLTAKRLLSKKCIVKRLQAVETLGSIRTICSDKTGTLTQNKMTVAHISVNNKKYDVTGGVCVAMENEEKDCTYKTLLRAACLCSRVEFDSSEENEHLSHKVTGDATEIGIAKFVKFTVQTYLDVRNAFPKVAEIPFNSMNKYSLSVHRSPLNQHFAILKGAPEVVLDKCTAILIGEKEYFLTAEIRYDIEETLRSFASKGERVIAFSDKYFLQSNYPINYKFTTDPLNFPAEEFRFIGLISLFDPPKIEVPQAIQTCREAGIRVIMVTGDHPLTAKCIAKKINIFSENVSDSCLITGSELRVMSDMDLKKVLSQNEELVFARTSPIQKLRIVEQCQSLNNIVAVIGDGVNDAPALKKADIGIAMGITGSEVSKQTADMILMDDNFATIVLGIEEGRLIFDNLKKSIAYVLASNIPEIAPFLAYIFLGIPLPVSTVTVLCIDLGTDMWPAVSLAYEKAESNILKRRPRNPKRDRLVSRKLVMYAYLHIGFFETLAGFLTYFHVMSDAGWLPQDLIFIRQKWESENSFEDSFGKLWTSHERNELEFKCQTAYFIAIVVAQWADLIICKTRYNSLFQQKMNNWVLNLGLIFETLLTCFVAYTPYVNSALRTRPVELKYWITPLPMALFIIVYDEVRKALIRMYPMSILSREFTY